MGKRDLALLVGRDNWEKDETLNVLLLDYLKRNRIDVVWEDRAAELVYRLGRLGKRSSWELLPKGVIRIRVAQLVAGLMSPSYFVRLYNRRKRTSDDYRCAELKKIIQKTGNTSRVIILSRSSGGRVASSIADELNLKCIICLGYPFKHPDRKDEPERYRHLAEMRTPMLIFQGVRDVYGGMEIQERYAFSRNVELCFVDTDHEFGINDQLAQFIFKKMASAIGSNDAT